MKEFIIYLWETKQQGLKMQQTTFGLRMGKFRTLMLTLTHNAEALKAP